MKIEHNYAFNVDPTNFLGFFNYAFHTNASKTKLYAVLLECANTEIPARKELENLFFKSAPLNRKWCFINKWQGEVNKKNQFIISYSHDGKSFTPLKEKTKYTIAYF